MYVRYGVETASPNAPVSRFILDLGDRGDDRVAREK